MRSGVPQMMKLLLDISFRPGFWTAGALRTVSATPPHVVNMPLLSAELLARLSRFSPTQFCEGVVFQEY